MRTASPPREVGSTWPAVAAHVANNIVSVLTIAGGLDGFERGVSRGVLAVACAALLVGALAAARIVRRQVAGWTDPHALG